ncbi:hypothetical protein [Halobaculum sp. EA56]|uniref:hypothetical protein n=1 Tax=Halobaculum sp. EA56 TaxID=3421648 RepID=UPI003EB7D775
MDRTFLASAALTALSLVGYVAGTASPYPGREASLAGVMVGVTLVAVTYGHGSTDGDGPDAAGATVGGTEHGEREHDERERDGDGVASGAADAAGDGAGNGEWSP